MYRTPLAVYTALITIGLLVLVLIVALERPAELVEAEHLTVKVVDLLARRQVGAGVAADHSPAFRRRTRK